MEDLSLSICSSSLKRAGRDSISSAWGGGPWTVLRERARPLQGPEREGKWTGCAGRGGAAQLLPRRVLESSFHRSFLCCCSLLFMLNSEVVHHDAIKTRDSGRLQLQAQQAGAGDVAPPHPSRPTLHPVSVSLALTCPDQSAQYTCISCHRAGFKSYLQLPSSHMEAPAGPLPCRPPAGPQDGSRCQ